MTEQSDRELIAEAKNYEGDNGTARWPSLIRELADALKARLPQPDEDEWEALTLIVRDVHLYDGGPHYAMFGMDAGRIAHAILNAGFSRSRLPRVVDREAEGRALPSATVLRDANGDIFETRNGGVTMTDEKGLYSWAFVKLPATVLFTPDVS